MLHIHLPSNRKTPLNESPGLTPQDRQLLSHREVLSRIAAPILVRLVHSRRESRKSIAVHDAILVSLQQLTFIGDPSWRIPVDGWLYLYPVEDWREYSPVVLALVPSMR